MAASEVQRILERTAPALLSWGERGLLNEHEIRALTTRRRDFEYQLVARAKSEASPLDVWKNAAEYEEKLHTMLTQRRSRMGIHKPSPHDHQPMQRALFIWQRAVRRLGKSVDAWLGFAAFARRHHHKRAEQDIFPKATALHPHSVPLWLAAAAAAWDNGAGDVGASRAWLQRGLRALPPPRQSPLWLSLFRLEVQVALRRNARRRVLGLGTASAGEGDGTEAAAAQVAEGGLALVVAKNAAGVAGLNDKERLALQAQLLRLSVDVQAEASGELGRLRANAASVARADAKGAPRLARGGVSGDGAAAAEEEEEEQEEEEEEEDEDGDTKVGAGGKDDDANEDEDDKAVERRLLPSEERLPKVTAKCVELLAKAFPGDGRAWEAAALSRLLPIARSWEALVKARAALKEQEEAASSDRANGSDGPLFVLDGGNGPDMEGNENPVGQAQGGGGFSMHRVENENEDDENDEEEGEDEDEDENEDGENASSDSRSGAKHSSDEDGAPMSLSSTSSSLPLTRLAGASLAQLLNPVGLDQAGSSRLDRQEPMAGVTQGPWDSLAARWWGLEDHVLACAQGVESTEEGGGEDGGEVGMQGGVVAWAPGGAACDAMVAVAAGKSDSDRSSGWAAGHIRVVAPCEASSSRGSHGLTRATEGSELGVLHLLLGPASRTARGGKRGGEPATGKAPADELSRGFDLVKHGLGGRSASLAGASRSGTNAGGKRSRGGAIGHTHTDADADAIGQDSTGGLPTVAETLWARVHAAMVGIGTERAGLSLAASTGRVACRLQSIPAGDASTGSWAKRQAELLIVAARAAADGAPELWQAARAGCAAAGTVGGVTMAGVRPSFLGELDESMQRHLSQKNGIDAQGSKRRRVAADSKHDGMPVVLKEVAESAGNEESVPGLVCSLARNLAAAYIASGYEAGASAIARLLPAALGLRCWEAAVASSDIQLAAAAAAAASATSTVSGFMDVVAASLAAAAEPLAASVQEGRREGSAVPAVVWLRAARLAAVMATCCPGMGIRRLLALWPRSLAAQVGPISTRPAAEVIVMAVVRMAVGASAGASSGDMGGQAMQDLRMWLLDWAERRGSDALEAALPVATHGRCPASVWLHATECALEGVRGALPGADASAWLRRAGPGAAAAAEAKWATASDAEDAAEVWLIGHEWLLEGGEGARASKWHMEAERTLLGASKTFFLEQFALRRAVQGESTES